MRIELNIHTENTDIFKGEKKDFQGQIHIPKTDSTISQYGLTSDKSFGRETNYILNCYLGIEPSEVEEVVNWLYSKLKNNAVKLTIGDLRGKSDFCKVDKEEILKILNKWIG